MELKNLDDVLKFQQMYADQLIHRLRPSGDRARASDQDLKAKQFLLDDAKAALAETRRRREEVLKSLDQRIELQTSSIARLEEALRADETAFTTPSKTKLKTAKRDLVATKRKRSK
jgi:hypothetical protein